MRLFKTKIFDKWAKEKKISDQALINAIREMDLGLCEANLGGNLYKKRIAMHGKGKSGSYRTIVAFKRTDNSFFVYGFSKNKRDNISKREELALKKYATLLLNYTNQEINDAIETKGLIEVKI